MTAPGLLEAQRAATAGGMRLTGGRGFHFVVLDHDVLPEDPATALARGAADGIDILMGGNTDEYRLWFIPAAPSTASTKPPCGPPPSRTEHPGGPHASTAPRGPRHLPAILGAMVTDKVLRVPLNRLADARDGPARPDLPLRIRLASPQHDLGACHALEIGFVFDTLGTPDSLLLTGETAPRHLAEAMHRAWVTFAVSGDPGWPQWSAERPVMTYETDGARVVLAPRERERGLWT